MMVHRIWIEAIFSYFHFHPPFSSRNEKGDWI